MPLRLISRTPAPSRRAMMRKPSCLISWSQFEPVGGFLAGDGRQGSMKLTVPRLRINMGWRWHFVWWESSAVRSAPATRAGAVNRLVDVAVGDLGATVPDVDSVAAADIEVAAHHAGDAVGIEHRVADVDPDVVAFDGRAMHDDAAPASAA